MGKPRPGFKTGELVEHCIFCGKKLPAHRKSCALTEEQQDTLATKFYCPLCGEAVNPGGDHVCGD
jgi:predicted RNA-binding Zn-ribbon protein involved in translation (DUF1610 family)